MTEPTGCYDTILVIMPTDPFSIHAADWEPCEEIPGYLTKTMLGKGLTIVAVFNGDADDPYRCAVTMNTEDVAQAREDAIPALREFVERRHSSSE